MKTIAIANQKGGMGKTTLALNLAYFAVEQGLRVLCVDMQPHGDFTRTLRTVREHTVGDRGDEVQCLTSSALFDDASPALGLLECGERLTLVPADVELVDLADRPLEDMFAPRSALASLSESFDLCIIDTAPVMGRPLYAALIASDFVVCPCWMDQFAIDGLEILFENIGRVQQEGWNSNLNVLGLVANKYNPRRKFEEKALLQLRAELGSLVMDGVLNDRAATQNAKERPVWRVQSGESQINAAREMKAVCAEIFRKATI